MNKFQQELAVKEVVEGAKRAFDYLCSRGRI